CQNYDNSPYSF
nr:immunoglobulin light chain junction region [Macaca mulatta]MOW39453.1 immunoglobulin light chain junction region [Macaca mulatta]MOW39501.1 immunoglobulin light chain junction region [Macaca mulatta]MOW39992.1 immunoglobulin light chain junction region [Macaca mulatta]MOW40117.1 immunoglobulin light chain junction region [Macaca mulatta]